MHDWVVALALSARVVEMDSQARNVVPQADAAYIYEHMVETADPVIVVLDSRVKNAGQLA
jgi:hypothetical protein